MTAINGESPETVRFASCLGIDSYSAVVNDWHTSLLKPVRLYRRYRPATLIMSLLLASGNVERKPGPIYQYPCTVCSKPVKSNQRGIACNHCQKWTHAHCAHVGEAEYLLLAADEDCKWFCPLCLQSDICTSKSCLSAGCTKSLVQKSDEVGTNGAKSSVVVFSVSDDGEADVPKQQYGKLSAKKQRTKNENYYEQNKLRIKSNRKQRYYANPQVQKCASKASYHTNPEPKKGLPKPNIKMILHQKERLHVHDLK